MQLPVQSDALRIANRRAVYRALATHGDLTRAELALATRLSTPTVSSIVGEFVAQRLVVAAGTESGTGGRPAQRHRFDARARSVLAVDLSGRRATACTVDLRGYLVRGFEGPTVAPGGIAELVDWLAPLVADDEMAVRRLALAVPGVVDPIDGRVHLAPALGWHDHDAAATFRDALGVPVVLENDVNALALAELHYGAGTSYRHVLYVAIGSGVGAGLVIDGRLYRGAHAAAGELGYALPHGGARSESVAPRDEARRGAEPGPFERALLAVAEGCVDIDGLLDLSRPGAEGALDAVVAILRPVLHNLACVLDPELLVIAWPADPSGRLAARLRDAWEGPWPLPIAAGTLGPHAAARGAASIALEQLEAEICGAVGGTHDVRPPGLRPHVGHRRISHA
ncbi:MAG: ROK family transcriptional regulator [Trueperaceae bacterium]|nr:ROK family transcriptional regulator [Trueperaceae bacterium]